MSQNDSEQSESSNGPDVPKEWMRLAKAREIQMLGKLVLDLHAVEEEHLRGFAMIIVAAQQEQQSTSANSGAGDGDFTRAAKVLIEAFLQRKDGPTLAKTAYVTWRMVGRSSLLVRCIDAAIEAGPLDEVYEIAHGMLTGPTQASPEAVQCAAQLLLRLAEANHENAFFIVGEILRDGTGVPKDLSAAKNWFLKLALRKSIRAAQELSMVPEAFEQVAKILGSCTSHDFCLHQEKAVARAIKDLGALVPGDEITTLIEGDETATVEFKRLANKEPRVIQCVAAFLNTKGGYLFVGICSDKKSIGLDESFQALNVSNRDAFERHLRQKFRSNLLGIGFNDIDIDFPPYHGKEICRIRVSASRQPVYLKNGTLKEFWVRPGNENSQLSPSQTAAYLSERWPSQ